VEDRKFLLWLRDRLVHVYKESENTDFIHKLTGIAYNTPSDQDSSWIDPFTKRSDGSTDDLQRLSEGRRI
jgi:hypothetical protein